MRIEVIIMIIRAALYLDHTHPFSHSLHRPTHMKKYTQSYEHIHIMPHAHTYEHIHIMPHAHTYAQTWI